MNYMLIPTCGLALILFATGMLAGRATRGLARSFFSILGLVMATPGVVFAIYCLKILCEPIWMYRFRSLPWTELAGSGAGFLARLLHGKFSAGERFRRIAGIWFFPGILGLGLLIPYLKPIVRPPDWKHFQDRWSEGVCLQTSESSCGPACAATLLRRAWKTATEEQIARASCRTLRTYASWQTAATLGLIHLLLYAAFILLVPVSLITAGLLFAWNHWTRRSEEQNQKPAEQSQRELQLHTRLGF